MKQVNIIKDFEITNSAQFATQEEAEAWVNHHSSQGNFGQDFSVEYSDVVDNSAQEAANAAARKYLADTDWYCIREFETGIPCPQEIKDARQAARDSIID